LLAIKEAKPRNFTEASSAYTIARIYGVYDMKRVSDKTAHQAISVLTYQILDALTEEEVEKLGSAGANGPPKEALAWLKRHGKPTYHPNYMIQHGIQTFTGTRQNNGLVPEFSEKKTWEEIMENITPKTP
jgi:hypothetical protein